MLVVLVRGDLLVLIYVMKGQQLFHGFEFHNDAIFDEEIDSIASVQSDASIFNRQPNLVLKMQTSKGELVLQARLIRAFEQSWSERRVNPDRRVDDAAGNVFVDHDGLSSVPSVSSVVERLESTGSQRTGRR